MRTSYKTTLDDMLIATRISDRIDDARTPEEWLAVQTEEECRAEQEAELAWLRHAESRGWQKALLEQQIESGFRSRY